MQINHTQREFWKEKEYQNKLEQIERLRCQYHKTDSLPRLLRYCRYLIRNTVEYIIVGGYAVGIHGVPRYTGDLDILVDSKESNISSLFKAIKHMNFSEIPSNLDQLLLPNSFIQLGSKPQKIDFLNEIPMPSFNFEVLYSNKLTINLDGLQLHFISDKDLILNKLNCIRKKDKDDIQFLHLDKA